MSSACSRSPRPAAAAMASRWSVTFAIALTTTKGCSCRRALMMLATRSMALASSTEVPPNFITITAAPPSYDVGRRGSRQVALHLQEFGVEQCRTSRAANGVVREHGELVVENAAGAQASDGDRHAMAAVHVEARLRTVGGIVVHDGLGGREWQPELLRSGMELLECGDDLLSIGLLLKFYR